MGASKKNPNAVLKKLPLLQDRSCGSCTACCKALRIDVLDLSQPWERPCPKLVEAGCSIYDDRPSFCRTFYCLWRRGVGDAHERPDRIGVLLQATQQNVPGTSELGITAHEIEPGIFGGPRANEIDEFILAVVGGRLVYKIHLLPDGKEGYTILCEDSEKLERFREALDAALMDGSVDEVDTPSGPGFAKP